MKKRSVVCEGVLARLSELNCELEETLRAVSKEKSRREYRNDILQLAATDVSLLTSYYMNSNLNAQKKFEELLREVYLDDDSINQFIIDFKNLYYLKKNNNEDDIKYGAAKRKILEFINKLKDQAIAEKKINNLVEKEYADKHFIVKKLLKYYSAPVGSVEIKNIDDFILMLNVLGLNDDDKKLFLIVAIENNSKFYSKTMMEFKKNKFDILDD